MSKGFVYVLTNPAMPGIVKIGKTTRTPQHRCDELWQTGVPARFEVYAAVLAPDCHELEAFVHATLLQSRVSPDREFFAVEPECARAWIMAGA